MKKVFKKILQGYKLFRDKYVNGDKSVMKSLSYYGQAPQIMVVACCDSRVDPALILQCDPGDLFVLRNVANIIPPYENDEARHGTSAALEFGICSLHVKHLILLGHSQCGGIQALLESSDNDDTDFIKSWVSVVKAQCSSSLGSDECARSALKESRKNCMTFPWINEKVTQRQLDIHLWFFDIKSGQIFSYNDKVNKYQPLCSVDE